LVSSPKFIRDRNNFSAEQKASKQLQERRAVKEDEGGRAARGARAAGSKGRGGAGSANCSSWQLADQRRAQLQQRFADLAVHLAQRQLKNLR